MVLLLGRKIERNSLDYYGSNEDVMMNDESYLRQMKRIDSDQRVLSFDRISNDRSPSSEEISATESLCVYGTNESFSLFASLKTPQRKPTQYWDTRQSSAVDI